MYIIDVILLTKIPIQMPQIFSYFSGAQLPPGAVILVPLGKRKETGIVIDSHLASDYKLEIKKADFEMKNILKIISAQPLLTRQQIELALWLGQYYFCSPGLFAKMAMPRQRQQPTTNSQQPTQKNQKLIIAPTISSAQRIAKQNQNAILWHSELPKKQQTEIWWKVKNGEAQTIIGTRSAVFLPFSNLKEIIIEDETNPAHRSWDMFPHWRTREAAQKLAEIFGTKIKFISPISPMGLIGLIIDLRQELREGNFSIFSRALQNAIREALARKKQIILFINRRGAANFVLCRDCGYIAKCQNCDAPLAHHLINGKPTLLCHRCGYKEIPPDLCPKCQSHKIKTVGVGTQKVEIEAAKFFPKAGILRLDSDSAPSAKEQQKIIDTFAKKEADILITTQIIFSWLDEIRDSEPAVVALISADTLLHLPDYQSGERTFQIITALRSLSSSSEAKIPPSPPFRKGGLGGIFIQSYNPQNSVIQRAAQGDWKSFYKEEIETRQALNYPPFSQIVKLTFRHRDPKKAGMEAKILAAKLTRAMSHPELVSGSPPRSRNKFGMTKTDDIQISPALPAFIPKEKGKYIWNIIIKFPAESSLFRKASSFNSPPLCKASPSSSPLFKGGLGGILISNEFLLRRNSLLQYIPSNWEIDVDPVDLL